jgi:hypothetical protein
VGVQDDNQSFAGVESKKIQGRPVVLKNYKSIEDLGSTSCQLLYIKSAPEKSLQNYLKKSASAPVVSIGESQGFTRLGGTIEFVNIKDRLSFVINNSEAKQRRLQINASLLDLAQEVY